MTLIEKPFFRWRELESRYGASVLDDLLAAKWLAPRVKRHRLSLYAAEDVAQVDARLNAGEYPDVNDA